MKQPRIFIFLLSTSLFLQEAQSFLPASKCIVSLGSNCRVATWLRALNIRTRAYPFDWVESEDINSLTQLIQDDFEGYLESEKLAPSYNYFYNRIRDTSYNIHFVHDFSFQGTENFSFAIPRDYNHGILCLQREYGKFYEKYMRRIQRFRALTYRYEQVIFVRTLLVDKVTAQELYAALQILFNNSKKIILVVISDKEEFKTDWHLQGIKNFYMPQEHLTTDGYEGAFKQILQEILHEK